MTQGLNVTPVALKCPQCSADLIPGAGDYIVCRYCGSSADFNPNPGSSQGWTELEQK